MFVSAFMITHQVHNALKEIKVTGIAAVTPFPVWFATVSNHRVSSALESAIKARVLAMNLHFKLYLKFFETLCKLSYEP